MEKKELAFLLLSFNFKKTMQISIKQNMIIMINIKQTTWEFSKWRDPYSWSDMEGYKGVEILS